MQLVDFITDSPSQKLILLLENGTRMNFNIRFFDNQDGWFFDLIYGSFAVYNRRIVTSPNLLRQFRGIIPFGLACVTSDGHEPIFQNDFLTKRAKIYLVDSDEVESIEDSIANAKTK